MVGISSSRRQTHEQASLLLLHLRWERPCMRVGTQTAAMAGMTQMVSTRLRASFVHHPVMMIVAFEDDHLVDFSYKQHSQIGRKITGDN